MPQASPRTGISQCHVTRAGCKSGCPIPLNFPPVFSKLSWAAMGEARRRTPPKVPGCTADKKLPRAGQTNSSPAEPWFPPQAHLHAFSFFFKLLPRAARSQIPFKPMSAPFLSPQTDASQQFSDCHLSSLKFSFLLRQVLFSPCLLSFSTTLCFQF